jgi:hypothetical protein
MGDGRGVESVAWGCRVSQVCSPRARGAARELRPRGLAKHIVGDGLAYNNRIMMVVRKPCRRDSPRIHSTRAALRVSPHVACSDEART